MVPSLRSLLVVLVSLLTFPSLAQTSPAAAVNGQPITRSEVDAAIAERLTSLEQQIYTLRKSSLDNLVALRLLSKPCRARSSGPCPPARRKPINP